MAWARGPQKLDRLLDETGERKWPRREIEPAGFDLRQIEQLLDERHQGAAGGFHGLEIGRLLGRQRGVAEQVGHAEDAVQRRADFMRDHRQEARLGAVRGFGLIARIGQRALGIDAVGDVAADALHLARRIGAHGDFPPGDPARAAGRGDFLVVDPRAVGQGRCLALRFHGQREIGAKQRLARPPGQRAERVIGVSDRAFAVAADDDVALRLEKALGAFLRLLEFPMAIFRVVEARLEAAQFGLHLADARQQNAHAAAGGAEQCGDANGERVRIVMCQGDVAPDRKPNATANDIEVMASARTISERSRRLRIAGFPKLARSRMVFVPARHKRLARRRAASSPGSSMWRVRFWPRNLAYCLRR